MMQHGTADKGERAAQKAILVREYEDYNPVRHDVFVMRYNKDLEIRRQREYRENRGIE